jgi:exonuclease VII large subunit
VAPLGTLVATSLGSLIGLLGGAPGVAIGALSGLTVGGVADVANFSIGEDFVADVTAALAPNTFAVVAEIEEDWTTPVDSRMEKIGGTVFRRSLSEVRDTIDREQIAAMKADRAQMKAEAAQAAADRKRKLGEKIDRLDAKIQAHMQKAKERRQAAESEAQAKAKILKSKVAAIRP